MAILAAFQPIHAAAPALARHAEVKSWIWELHWTRQLIVVTSDDWNAAAAHLQRFERKSASGRWRALGPAIDVAAAVAAWAGASGCTGRTPNEPIKREGDGRAPAGVFFPEHDFWSRHGCGGGCRAFLDREVTSSTRAVEDDQSRYYNRRLHRDAAR